MIGIDNKYKSFQLAATYQSKDTTHNRRFLSQGVLGLQSLIDIKNTWDKVAIVLCLSIMMGCVNFFFIERTGIYTPGINAFHQAIARLFLELSKNKLSPSLQKGIYTALFWGLNILFNLCFAIFCYKNIGKKFTGLTVLYVCGLSLTGLSLSLLPESWDLKNFYLFSNPKLTEGTMSSNNINLLTWPIEAGSGPKDGYKVFIIFLYGFVFGLFSTAASLIVYSLGAGTGGLDWLVFYLYKVKNYSSNKLLFYMGLAISFVSFIIGTYIPYRIHSPSTDLKILIANLLAPTFLATVIAIFTRKTLFNIFYPQFKLINAKIFTNKFIEIRKALMHIKFPHSFTITHSTGSFNLRTQTQLEFICFSVELSQLMSTVRKIDSNCLIISTPIKTFNGYIKINSNLK